MYALGWLADGFGLIWPTRNFLFHTHSVATLALRPVSKLTSGDCVQPVGPVAVVVKDVLGHLIVQSVQRSQVHLACLETVR